MTSKTTYYSSSSALKTHHKKVLLPGIFLWVLYNIFFSWGWSVSSIVKSLKTTAIGRSIDLQTIKWDLRRRLYKFCLDQPILPNEMVFCRRTCSFHHWKITRLGRSSHIKNKKYISVYINKVKFNSGGPGVVVQLLGDLCPVENRDRIVGWE